uniref:Uncharacterized protein n=1 Tax=Bubo bubo TaxID=30461 RepID=A0A8C0FJZ9_BUBBB
MSAPENSPSSQMTRKCTQKRNAASVQNAGRASRGAPEQIRLSVLNVGRALAGKPTWWCIRESIQGRGPTSARNVRKPLAAPQTLSSCNIRAIKT